MRNIVQYPVTVSETYEILEFLINKELQLKAIGGIQPVVLSFLIDFIKQNEKQYENFLEVVHKRSSTPS